MAEPAAVPLDEGEVDSPAEFYERFRPLIIHIATRWYRIPLEDAADISHNIVVTFIRRRGKIRRQEKWLLGAAIHASRSFWRARGRERPLPGDLRDRVDESTIGIAERIGTRLDVAEVLRRLGQNCREIIVLRFLERYSASEIADERATTTAYARNLLYRCVKQFRALYHRMSRA